VHVHSAAGEDMKTFDLVTWLWVAGAIQLAIVLANSVLPTRLIYIVLTISLFSLLRFWPTAAGWAGSSGAPWACSGVAAAAPTFLLRCRTARQNKALNLAYGLAPVTLITIFGTAVLAPRA